MMNSDFVAEILRATGTLRSGDRAGATAIIRAALAAGGLASPDPAQGDAGQGLPLPRPADRPSLAGTIAPNGSDDASADLRATQPSNGHRVRMPLGKVLATLAEGRKALGIKGKLPALGMQSGAPDLSPPDGAEFRESHFSCAEGARRYRLYIPALAGGKPQGLVVMLHGCTQNPEDFAAGTGMNALADEHRLLIAYPAQTQGDNSMSCWNWFRPGDQMRDAGEPAIIASLTRTVRDEFGIAQDRVFVAGLSAGGAMAAILGETYPELYACIGIHSGLAHGSASDVASAFSAMRGQAATGPRPRMRRVAQPRAIVFHGSADTTVHPSNAERIIAILAEGRGATVRSDHPPSGGIRGYSKRVTGPANGDPVIECWIVDGAPHAWSGGHSIGSHTDPQGPDASGAMVRFFLGRSSEGGAPAANDP